MTELKKIEPGTFDGIICSGIYYHITYHVELMKELRRLDVDWIIMDTAVVKSKKPSVQWSMGPNGLEGTPSLEAIEVIAKEFDFQVEQLTTNQFGTPSMWDYNDNGRVTLTIF